ncbi:potassium channel family protein [Candidatus Woesearchaeota archaeon]|nr:potassium channel family protein [Candidatus Woesearchaeota archaeon]
MADSEFSGSSGARSLHSFIDRVTFLKILVIWLVAVVVFGLVYFFASGDVSYLLVSETQEPVSSLHNSVYFSFVSATTTGFGDIIPYGFFKVLATFEVVLSLLVVAVVTSKLISLKQNVILGELYEITFAERVNRIRSSLLFFRQNTNNLTHKAEEGSLRKREVQHLHGHLSSLQETMEDATRLFRKPRDSSFVRRLDGVEAGLLGNSVVGSLRRMADLVDVLEEQGVEWRTKRNLASVEQVLAVTERFFGLLRKSSTLPKQRLDDLVAEKDRVCAPLDELAPRRDGS